MAAEIEQTDLIDQTSTSKGNRIMTCLQNSRWKIFTVSLILLLGLLIGIIIYVEVYQNSFHIRVDCQPDLPLNYEKCLDRGCIWVPRKDSLEPPCFFPHGYGYRLKAVRETSVGYSVDLERSADNVIYGKEVKNVNLQVYFETRKRLHFKFVDPGQRRYEVPLPVPETPAQPPEKMDYKVDFVNDPQFGIVVTRKSNGNVIFDSNIPGMVFSDQYIQISTKLSTANIYGLGEHTSSEYRHSTNWKSLSFFARDTVPDNDDNLYGVHPFYMNLENNGEAHGVFFLNSNAMQVVLQPYPALTFRTIGGILDFYIFLGPSPEEVVQQYHEVIGFPFMPPYWSLGFHLSRYGYRNVDEVKNVSQRTIDADIPYDVQHFDIDYMEEYRDFTYDKDLYQTLPGFVDELHSKSRSVIIILDPAIASNRTLEGRYSPLDEGLALDIFIKMNGTILEGEVWPGKTYYPDFSHSEAHTYWSKMCADFHKIVEYDGLWIDMNEPSSFAEGSLNGCEKNTWNYPPYAAGVLGSKDDGKLFEKTICMDSVQQAGKHYDVHSLYGLFQANQTFVALAELRPTTRPMVLTRSTYPGSGKYAAHWLGDNNSSWNEMRDSIPGILEFNLYGIPFVGADICGFRSNVTKELCLRWMQLGSFYPFSRNHNSKESADQDPAVFGQDFITIVRRALLTRYELLPYLYTLFHLSHTQASTVARPLLHEFPQDRKTWGISEQFLWGAALLISPILHEKADSVNAYIPEGAWYDFYSGAKVKDGMGTYVTVQDDGNVTLHVRGGHILPLQKPRSTTNASREMPMGLFVAPDGNGSASGLLFWDDGISYDIYSGDEYRLLEFNLVKSEKQMHLSSETKKSGFAGADKLKLGYITVCGQSLQPSQIEINEVKLSGAKWEYLSDIKVLKLERLETLNVTFAQNFTVVFQYA